MAVEQRRVTGPAKLIRGLLAAVTAVGSAALAHTAAGQHAPHALVVLLALAVSIPVCVQLSGVALSRRRLAAAVLSSQAVLHGLFALLPATSVGRTGLAASAHGHHGDSAAAPGAENAITTAAAHMIAGQTDTTMIATHLLAAAFAFYLLRRGETLLHTIAERLSVGPVLILLSRQPVPPAPRRIPLPDHAAAQRPIYDMWPGEGPRTLRGPPVLAA